MNNPLVAECLESDRKKAAEKKRKFEAEYLEEDSRTAAKRLEERNKTAAKRLEEDNKTAADHLKEDEQVKRRREGEDRMRGRMDDMTFTLALDLLGLSRETHLTMENIYAGWTWWMAGIAASHTCPYTDTERLEEARNMLLDYTVRHLTVDVSLPPMDHKQAADLLDISEHVNADEIYHAYETMMYFTPPPKNGMERYMQEKKLREAQRVMLANL